MVQAQLWDMDYMELVVLLHRPFIVGESTRNVSAAERPTDICQTSPADPTRDRLLLLQKRKEEQKGEPCEEQKTEQNLRGANEWDKIENQRSPRKKKV